MAKDPAFLWYVNDYIGGTMGMTFEEKGAYVDVLMMQFNRGHMSEHMIGQVIGQLWLNIKDKFKQDDEGLYYNERLEQEQKKRKNYTESRRNNKKGVNQYTKKRGHMTKHMIGHMENENENENRINNALDTFNIIWSKYPNKLGKKAALKHFKASVKTDKDVDNITKAIDNFLVSIKGKDPEYIPHGSTWFNNWQDWIDYKKPQKQKTADEIFEERLEYVKQQSIA